MANEIQFFLHRAIEYDAGEGREMFRVTASSEWLERERFEEFLKRIELGVFRAQVLAGGGGVGRKRAE